MRGSLKLWMFLACAAGFAALALAHESLAAFDTALLTGLREGADLSGPIGPAWVEEAARDVTALGGTFLIALTTGAIALGLVLNGKPRPAAFAIIAVAGAQALSEILKMVVHRVRPDLVPHEVAVYSASLPSGHAMMAAAAYFTLAYALARGLSRVRNRMIIYLAAWVLVALVGVSRVYLGVHWPTDVLAGWLAGGAWALAAAMIWRASRGPRGAGHNHAA